MFKSTFRWVLAIVVGIVLGAVGLLAMPKSAWAATAANLSLSNWNCSTGTIQLTFDLQASIVDLTHPTYGNFDNFWIMIGDTNGNTLYNQGIGYPVPGSYPGSYTLLPAASYDIDHWVLPKSEHVMAWIYDWVGEFETGSLGDLLDTTSITWPCLGQAPVSVPNAVIAQEQSRGIFRIFENYQDAVVYYPGDNGDLVIYTLVDGQGVFVGRFPQELLNGSQSIGLVETWVRGALEWRLYYLGNGRYQLNHYINGNLKDEFAFVP